MKREAAHDMWMAARSRLAEAERAAGIDKKLRDLNERNAYIASARQHFNDERAIVFDVPDAALRREVIRCNRQVHALCRAKEEEVLEELRRRVSDNGDKIRRSDLWGAVAFGVAAVWLGHWLGSTLGALIGTVVALLVGFDHIRRADRRAAADVKHAEHDIQEQTRFLEELGSDGLFSESEEASGKPDPEGTPVQRPIW